MPASWDESGNSHDRIRETAYLENLGCLCVHIVALTVYHLCDADLNDFDGACQTRAGVAVEHASIANAFPPCFEQGILFGMNAKAGAKICTSNTTSIAARTAAFVTVGDIARGAVVARGHNSLVSHKNTADLPPHAVASSSRQRCQSHEVLVPSRPYSAFIWQVQSVQSCPKFGNRGCGVEELDLSPRSQRRETRGRIQMLVVA